MLQAGIELHLQYKEMNKFILKPIDANHINLTAPETGSYRDFCFTYDELEDICNQFQMLKQAKGSNGEENDAPSPTPPKTDFKPFQQVMVRDNEYDLWRVAIFSHIQGNSKAYPYAVIGTPDAFAYCIPYNELTKHLQNTPLPIDSKLP